MQALYSIPPILFLIIVLALAVTFACVGQIVIHRRLPATDFIGHNDVTGHIIAVVGTLYAVLLGFITVVVWEHYNDAKGQVSLESAAAADAWHTAVGLPYPVRSRIRRDLVSYGTFVAQTEWEEMRHGSYSVPADLAVMDAMATAGSFAPANARESNAQLATLQQLSVLHDERQRRLTSNDSPVSSFEWLILLVGALCVVCFCWLFGLRNPRVHLLMTATVTIVVTATLVLLFELQYPFRSAIGIQPSTWEAFMDHVHLMQRAVRPSMGM